MTVIAGVVTKDGTVIGSDRMTSSCSVKFDSPGKIVERGGWAYAATGNPRTIQIFERVSRSHKLGKFDDVFELAEEFFKKLKDAGLGSAKDGELQRHDSAFLIAVPDSLYGLDSNLGVYTHPQFYAHGIGREYALGVLYDGIRSREAFDGVDLVRRAVEAANAMNPHCGGGPDIARVAIREQKLTVSVTLTESGRGAQKIGDG